MKKEKPLLVDTGKGFTVRYKGRYLYSSIKPTDLIEKRVEHIVLRERTLFFIPSIGLGYGLHSLCMKCPESSHILCVEIDETLMRFSLKQNVAALPASDRLTMVRTGSPVEVVRAVKKIGTHRFRRVEMCSLSGGYHLYPEAYRKMLHLIEEEITNYWKNKITLVHMAPLWIKNIFLNLMFSRNTYDIAMLKTQFPILVVGAGPSLEDSIATIRRIRKKVILITVDTAYSALCAHSIIPDYIFILESQIANLQDFIARRDPDIPILCDITAHPATIRLFKGDMYFFSSIFYPIRLLERIKKAGLLPAQIPALGSVGVAALYISMYMTEGPVLVTGLDFSYPGGRTHARGTPFPCLLSFTSSRLLPLEHLMYRSIRKRPLVTMSGKQGVSLSSDLVLRSYAQEVKYLVEGKENIYDIGKEGIDIGIQPLLDDQSIDRILCEGEKKIKTMSGGEGEKGCNNSCSPEKRQEFLMNEKKYLEQAEMLITNILETNTINREDFTEEEQGVLDCIDYVYLHFPDHKPLPVLNKGFLFRVLVSISHYKKLIDKVFRIAGKKVIPF
jgi:hypothetical protein